MLASFAMAVEAIEIAVVGNGNPQTFYSPSESID
jgi:hypothetical protein